MKTSLSSQLNQTNRENRLHTSREGPREGFKDAVFDIL